MFEVLSDIKFRESLQSELSNHNENYLLPKKVPTLYKYCGFSKYSVENIINNSFSLSLISSFNDCFDSTISLGNIEEKAVRISESLPISLSDSKIGLNEIQTAYKDFCTTSHCMCLSESCDSVLMWSHYANNQKGICIEYDFESIKKNPLYHCIFPVCYTETPIDVYNFVIEEKNSNSIETGILISILNKSKNWEYEKEWRLILLDESLFNNKPIKVYLRLNTFIKVKRIILGCNFLDNFFEELLPKKAKDSEKTPQKEIIELFERLVNAIKTNNIPVSIMLPVKNSFSLEPKIIADANAVYKFIEERVNKHDFDLRKRPIIYTEFYEEFFNN